MAESKHDIAGIVECPICKEKITDNRLLPCGHTFCLKCLEQYKQTAKSKGKSLQCPVCRMEFTIPNGGCSMFPKNTIVDKILGVKSNIDKDEGDIKLCDLCAKGKKAIANVHCIECDQRLCGSCERTHRKLKTCLTHRIIPVSKASQLRNITKQRYCYHHPDYVLEWVCNECKEPICVICQSLWHESHTLTDVKEIAGSCFEELQSTIEELSHRLSIMAKLSEDIKDRERQMQENFDKEKERVTKTAADLIRSIITNEDILIKHLSSSLQRNFKDLQPYKLQVESHSDLLRQHRSSVEHLKESGNIWEILQKTEEFHRNASELLSSDLITINPLALSTLTESQIQNHLIGASSISQESTLSPLLESTSALCDSENTEEPLGHSNVHKTLTIDTPKNLLQEELKMRMQNRRKKSLVVSTDEVQLETGCQKQSKTEIKIQRPTAIATRSRVLERACSLDNSRVSLSNEDYLGIRAADTAPSVVPSQLYVNDRRQSQPQEQCDVDVYDTVREVKASLASYLPSLKGSELANHVIDVSTIACFGVGNGSAIFGIEVFKHKVYVSVERCPEIFVFSSKDHSLQEKISLPGLTQANYLAVCHKSEFLYMIDWTKYCISRVKIGGRNEFTTWSTGEAYGGISVTPDLNILIASHRSNLLIEYSAIGKPLKTIALKSAVGECIRPWHAVKLSSGMFIISHGSSLPGSVHRVCLVNLIGEICKSFGSHANPDNSSLNGPYHFSVDAKGNTFVADCNNGRIVILNESLEYVDEVKNELRKPRRVCFDTACSQVYIADNKAVSNKATDGRVVILKLLYRKKYK